ncbi:TRAP transporter small permease [Photobacterium sp. GJ3]|uniref:TRAP transporter small permease subunit n=1 Tax=Photobacterium sp. GJ3 TaxID=2829502 RepID=UPI001B8D149D|nr:TRAP transporter small permease [Photobacterium sp. GJ3]QUJ66631.1 TRAP transporter small permease [Photobacterium sp. GJ3]
MNRIVIGLKRLNDWVAVVAGIALLGGVALICAEILFRAFSVPFSGSEEISGYLMASITSWGVSYGLLNLAHIRIDILRKKSSERIRSLLDLVSIAAVSFVSIYIAMKAITVVEKSMNSGALSNTALEIPLIIPQTIWFAGWVWFAISATTLFIAGVYLFFTQRTKEIDNSIGVRSEA